MVEREPGPAMLDTDVTAAVVEASCLDLVATEAEAALYNGGQSYCAVQGKMGKNTVITGNIINIQAFILLLGAVTAG